VASGSEKETESVTPLARFYAVEYWRSSSVNGKKKSASWLSQRMRQWVDRKLALRGDSRGKYLIRSEILDEFRRTASDVGFETQVSPIQGPHAEQLRAEFARLGEAIAVYGTPMVIPNASQVNYIAGIPSTDQTSATSFAELAGLREENAALKSQVNVLATERDQWVQDYASLESQLQESRTEVGHLAEQLNQLAQVQGAFNELKEDFQQIQDIYVVIGEIFIRMSDNAKQGQRSDPTEILDELFPDPQQQERIQATIEATYQRLKGR